MVRTSPMSRKPDGRSWRQALIICRTALMQGQAGETPWVFGDRCQPGFTACDRDGAGDCSCIRSAEGNIVCIQRNSITACAHSCNASEECEPGLACVDISGCCGELPAGSMTCMAPCADELRS